MSIAVGIFDEDAGLEQALERLQETDLEPDAIDVLDPARRRAAQADQRSGETPGAGDAILPGVAPSVTHAGVAVGEPAEQARAFRSMLAGRISDTRAVDHYCRILDHDGVLVIVDAEPAKAENAAGLMRENGASRVDIHS